MKDTKIIALLWQRKESALDQILSQYGRMLRHFAARILPTMQDAEECINDALLDVWNTIPPKRPESIASYTVMLTRRRAIDKLRSMTAKKRGGGVYPMALEELEECIPGGSGFDEDAEALREAINSFLASLSEKDRLIFTGRYFALESVSSLAEKNGITENTIHIRLTRMRSKLKNWLKERSIFI